MRLPYINTLSTQQTGKVKKKSMSNIMRLLNILWTDRAALVEVKKHQRMDMVKAAGETLKKRPVSSREPMLMRLSLLSRNKNRKPRVL